MSDDELIPTARLRVMQIIAAALPAGVVMMAGIILFLVYGQAAGGQPPQLPIVSLMAGLFFAINGTMSFVVPGFMTQAGLKQIAGRSGENDVSDLLNLRQTTMIIGLALVEGAAFFGLVGFLIDRQPLVLIVPGLGLLAMLLRFPTANSVRGWMEAQGRRVLELRQDRA